jgi:Zn-dependent protease with chaperone function
VTLDRANRSFLVLIGTGVLVGAFAVWGAMAGVLEPMLRNRMSTGLGLHAAISLIPAALLVAIVAIGAVLGCASLARHAVATARLSRQIRTLRAPLPAALRHAAADAGLSGRVVLIDVSTPSSYVYHALRPCVVVSRGLLAALSDRQLRAVLEHERYHVINLDPLKLALTRATRAALYTLPLLETLQRRYLCDRELAADRRAVNACGRDPLVGALLKVVDTPDVGRHIVAAIADPPLLSIRIHQLESGVQPRPASLSRTKLAASLLINAMLVATFFIAVWWLGGSATVVNTTGTGLVEAILIGGAVCTVPFATVGLLGYAVVATRARGEG